MTSAPYSGAVEVPTDPNGPTGRLSAWLHRLRFDDVPASVRKQAKALILDGLGCALVGAQLPWSRTAVDVVTRIEGSADRTIIGWGRSTSAPAAALLNGTFIQGFELDDFYPPAPLHCASLVLPATLACSEELGGVSGQTFLLGVIAGCEVGTRVGLALHGTEMLSRGWHSGAVFGTHAAAAAAGVLLALDPSRFEDALGLAGTQSSGLMAAQFGAMCKRMHHGLSARNGLYGALLAAGGYTGVKRVFEQEYGGFLAMFGEGHSPDPTQIDRGLGETWETQAVALKRYAAMGGLHSPLDAVFEIDAKRKLVPGEIARIDVDLPKAMYHHGWWKPERPLTPVGAQMNVAYALSVAILDGVAMVHQFSPQRIDQDDVWRLIPKVTAHHDLELDKGGRGAEFAARVTIHFTDGAKLESFRPTSRTICEPMSEAEVVSKFRLLTGDLGMRDRQQAIIDCVLGLESLDDVSTLPKLLAPEVGSTFR
jgi:2-methylcitrate dehydratase PrpD